MVEIVDKRCNAVTQQSQPKKEYPSHYGNRTDTSIERIASTGAALDL